MKSRYLHPGLNDLPPSQVLGKPTLRLTNPYTQGAHVLDAQRKLVSAGFPLKQFGIDGVYGPETQFAVKQFQAKNGLAPDGIVGTETWMALYAVTASSPGGSAPQVTAGGGGSSDNSYNIRKWALLGTGAIIAGIAIAKISK